MRCYLRGAESIKSALVKKFFTYQRGYSLTLIELSGQLECNFYRLPRSSNFAELPYIEVCKQTVMTG